MERIETLSSPGTEEARQSHAGGTAFGTARSSADFASDDQGTNTALGQIVVRWHTGIRHEHKEFGQKAFDPFAKGMHKRLGLDKGCAHLPQLLLKGVLKRHSLGKLFGGRQVRVWRGSAFGPFVDLLDLVSPLPQIHLVKMQLFEIVDIAQEMDPTSLMQTLMDVVSSVKIAA